LPCLSDILQSLEKASAQQAVLEWGRKVREVVDRRRRIGREVVWLVTAPKQSLADVVTVFRGVARTGDSELRMLESVTHEVPEHVRRTSLTNGTTLKTLEPGPGQRADVHGHPGAYRQSRSPHPPARR
jgi:hypothetical protein